MPDHASTQLRLQPTATAAATARRRLSEACRGRLSPEAEETARLLVSELVTNCVRHAHSMITLAIDCGDDAVAVAVADDADALPIVREGVDATSVGGRGMRLVDTLAGAWGIRPREDGGKIVWFRLP